MEAAVATNSGTRIELEYECFGRSTDPPVLLIMGLGAQMIAWPDEFCAALVGHGLYVVRFDNRDAGLSTHLHEAAAPDVRAALAGDTASASYTLSDMAADAAGLLDALGIPSAHVVGCSLGGMIAQTLAIEHPHRVRTLTSMLAATGDPSVGQATPAALAALLTPPAEDRQSAMDRAFAIACVIGSPGYPIDEAAVRDVAGRSYDRAFDPQGTARQLVAVLASGDRTERLGSLRVPALVLHGAQDPLVDPSGARATAAAIPGAELELFDGLGHDLPSELWADFARRIASLALRAERGRQLT